MYTSAAEYYDRVYDFLDNRAEAARVREIIAENAPSARTLLDVGCGSGRHLEHLRQGFEVEGLDLNGELLALAARRCPGVPFHEASMESFDLGRKFDVITCLFGAIAYTVTEDAMRRTVDTMVRHLRVGGLLIIEPWFTPDSFWSDTITSNHFVSADLKICWMYTSRRDGKDSVLDMHYLVGSPEAVQHFSEEHRLGLFTKEQHLEALRDSGLEATFDPEGPFGRGRGLYVARQSSVATA
jgi:SAM-dependent methyltransferase